MGVFDKITDQKRAAAILQRAILADRVSHAWLFTGPSAADLQTLALAFATTLQCTDRAPSVADACMQCKSCRQAIDGNHPDIRVWSHEKPKTFSVQEVRSLVQDVSIRPFSSERKVYIVPDAHLMRQEAQNALLKTLEEPPEYVVIILLAHTADAMLETIRSRCQMVELAAKDMEYDPELRKAAEEILLGISSWDLTQIRAAIQTLEEFKTDAARVLSLFASWYRDILYFKASMDPDGLLFPEQLDRIRAASGSMSFEGIQSVLDSIREATLRLDANVNFGLTMELLLLTMKEAASAP